MKSKIFIFIKSDEIEHLYKKICERIEKFSKISGLHGYSAKNLFKIVDKSIVYIKNEGKIGDFINAKDVIYFELSFTEIWLEVEMSLTSERNSFTISFDLKVENDSYISSLKNVLLKMGIKSWVQYIQDNEENPG